MEVFRLATDSNRKDGKDWFDTGLSYNSEEISKISDPDGGKGNEPSSIPTPFARIYLVNTAFRYVGDNKDTVDKNDTYGKIVSDCLDVAETFFRQKSLNKDKIKIVAWDKKASIEELEKSKSEGHKRLNRVLNMYLKDDERGFKFSAVDKVYLIKFNHRVIGSTSPLTLFCSTADDMKWIGRDIQFPNNDVAFDNEYCPLYKRSDDFQLWLYSMKRGFQNFSEQFTDLSRYMDTCLKKLEFENAVLYDKIHNLPKDYYATEYDNCDVHIVQGLNLRIDKGIVDMKTSDFMIKATKTIQVGHNPLALMPNHSGRKANGEKMRYQKGYYNSEVANVPYSDGRPINQRTLPGLGCEYPYLTTDDFLERHLIMTPDEINDKRFFCFNFKEKCYLLPIKKLYFDYFTTADLKRHISADSRTSGSIIVSLKIPLANNEFINYERLYINGDVNRDGYKGNIVKMKDEFNISIYPFLKFKDIKNSYSVGMFDVCNNTDTFSLKFYNEANNDLLSDVTMIQRSTKGGNGTIPNTKYHVVDNDFDYIEFGYNNLNTNSEYNAIIIPEFGCRDIGNDAFTFAVDFGTSNTHIEYRVDNRGEPKTLDIGIKDSDSQIGHLFNTASLSSPSLRNISKNEMIPDNIGDKSNYSFPVRTALISMCGFDFGKSTYPMANVNMSFVYEKDSELEKAKTHLNLKWANYSNNNDEKNKIEAYFANIMMLIRNKILLNNGSLDKTILVWFYPSSMPINMHRKLSDMWDKTYEKYVTDSNKPIDMSESIAPFYYYNESAKISSHANSVISVDIGGGTTDVVIYLGNKPKVSTSFKFAANSIFGDIGVGKSENGFMLKYINIIRSRIDGLETLKKILDKIEKERSSEEIATFMFSIENHEDARNNKPNLSFNKMLSDDGDFKIVFLVFYSSIIYHIASLFKLEPDIALPRHILFSGNGSKIVKIAAGTERMSELQKLTRLIFSKVLGRECNNIEIRLEKNPKEITSKGGVYGSVKRDDIDVNHMRNISKILRGDLSTDRTTKKEIGDCHNSVIINGVVEEYMRFVDMFMEIDKQLPYDEHFGLNKSTMNQFNEVMVDSIDLKEHIMQGFEEFKIEDADEIRETLFFYPIVRNMNKLASAIHSNNCDNE